MSTSEESDIPLAKRRKLLQQERGLQAKLPTKEVHEEKTVSPDSDYVVIVDDSEEEDIIESKPKPVAAAAAAKPPLPRNQWLPIPLRPINYGRKSVPIETKEPKAAQNGTTTAREQKIEEEEEEEKEESEVIIELSSTTEEEEDEDDDIERELDRARRVEQEVILLGHGSDDDHKMKQEQRIKPKRPPAAATNQRPPPASNGPSRPSNALPRPPSSSQQRPYGSATAHTTTNGNGFVPKGSRGPGRPRTATLDTPYEFQSREAATEFKRKFTPTGINHAEVEKRAKQILHEMTQSKQQEMQKSQVAWTQAAMKWREKNKPSEAELRRRAQEDSARASEAARRRAKITPSAHSARAAQAEAEAKNRNRNGIGNGGSGSANDKDDPPPPRPAANAPELERRSYYRTIAQRKVSKATSFDQVLKLLGVPCDDPSQIKYSYRIAVRMFHPDSNSKEKVWNTPEEKVQAEEVMKIINERKERDF